MFECFSGLQVQLPNTQFRWTSHSAVFELKVMSQCCWNWSQWAWVGFQSSCLHAVTRHSLQLKLKKFPRFLYLWSQVIRGAFNKSNCPGLTTTLLAKIPHSRDFFSDSFQEIPLQAVNYNDNDSFPYSFSSYNNISLVNIPPQQCSLPLGEILL